MSDRYKHPAVPPTPSEPAAATSDLERSQVYQTVPRALALPVYHQPDPAHNLLQAQLLQSALQQQHYRHHQELQQTLPSASGPDETIQNYGQLQAEVQQLQAKMAQRQEQQMAFEPKMHGSREQHHPSEPIIHDLSSRNMPIPSEARAFDVHSDPHVSSSSRAAVGVSNHPEMRHEMYYPRETLGRESGKGTVHDDPIQSPAGQSPRGPQSELTTDVETRGDQQTGQNPGTGSTCSRLPSGQNTDEASEIRSHVDHVDQDTSHLPDDSTPVGPLGMLGSQVPKDQTTNVQQAGEPNVLVPEGEQSEQDTQKSLEKESGDWQKPGPDQTPVALGVQSNTAQSSLELDTDQGIIQTAGGLEQTPVVPQSGATDMPSKHDKNQLQSILNHTLLKFCHDNLYFIEFAHVTGRFSFNVDNRETVHLVVSQITTPTAFIDDQHPTPQTAPVRKNQKQKVKTPLPKVSTPAGKSPRKRGRPRKVQAEVPAPVVEPTVPISSPEPATAGPSTSLSGSGRKAALKAKEKLNLLSQIKDDLVESDSEEGGYDPFNVLSRLKTENTDQGSDEEYTPDNDFNTTTRLPQTNKRDQTKDIDTPEKDETGTRMKVHSELMGFTIKKEIDDEEDQEETTQYDVQEKDDVREDEDRSPAAEVVSDDEADDGEQGDSSSDEQSDSGSDYEQVKKKPRLNKPRNEGDFQCDKCTRKFMTEREMKRHSSKHRKFRCGDEGCKDLEFYQLGTMRKHFRSVHGKGPKHLHRCTSCRREFLTREQLVEHTESSHSFTCSICKESFPSKVILTKHKDSSHLDLNCTICDRDFLTRKQLYRHLRRHREKESGKIQCDECAKTFTSNDSLYHHKRALHQGVRLYQCTQCDKTFNFSHSLRLHNLKHSGLRPYSCDVCHKSYLTSNHLKNHVKSIHAGHRPYVCPICDKRFPYDNSLKLHMRIHTGDRPFMCSICSKTFTTGGALKVHEANHIETKDFQCDLCSKKYKTKALLHNHKRLHDGSNFRFMCDICGSAFINKSTLEVHYDVHSDTRKHKCDKCDKTFKTYPSLYNHLIVHRDEHPFECNHCNKGFKSKGQLKAHELRHTGNKPYPCEVCGNCFPNKGDLSKHRKTVHAEQPRFACPVCGKLANRADNLRVHMKVHQDPALLKMTLEELLIKAPHDVAEFPSEMNDH